MRFLCHLGWHQWSRWRRTTQAVIGDKKTVKRTILARDCEACGLEQVKKV